MSNDTIADVLRRHRIIHRGGGSFGCRCDLADKITYHDAESHEAHLADAIRAALGLTEECGYGDEGDGSPEGWFSLADGVEDSRSLAALAVAKRSGRVMFSRLVSDWRPVDA